MIPASRRNEGMGYFGVSISIAMIFGPGLGLYMLEHYNHTFLFIISAVFILLALLLGLMKSSSRSGEIGVIQPITEKSAPIKAGQKKERQLLKGLPYGRHLFFLLLC